MTLAVRINVLPVTENKENKAIQITQALTQNKTVVKPGESTTIHVWKEQDYVISEIVLETTDV